jgi:hypothetical protein
MLITKVLDPARFNAVELARLIAPYSSSEQAVQFYVDLAQNALDSLVHQGILGTE